jgi:hypothetical protein
VNILQEGQFSRARAMRVEDYEHKHNGDAAKDDEPDDTHEVAAHKHVFGR